MTTYSPYPTQVGTVTKATTLDRTIKDILEAYLRNVKYDPTRCSRLSHDLCSIVKEKTKEILQRRLAVDAGSNGSSGGLPKLVVHLVIGQDTDQSVLLSSRCIWDASTDTLASATYRNNHVYAVCVVYSLCRTVTSQAAGTTSGDDDRGSDGQVSPSAESSSSSAD